MTGRERLLRVFEQKEVDRVPVAPFIHINFVNEFYGNAKTDAASKTIDVYEHFGFDIIHRNCTPVYSDTDIQSPDWQVEKDVEHDGRDRKTTTIIHTPKGDLKELHRLVWMSQYDAEASPVEYFIKSESDFNIFTEYQPPVSAIDTSPIEKARRLLSDKGVVAPWIQGAFNHVAFFYRRLDEIMLDAMTNTEFYNRMMEYFLTRNKQIVSQFIDAGADVVSYGGNIASGKLVGLDFFRKYIFSYEKRLIDFIKDRGAYVQFHNCGYAMNLFPAYRELEMNVYESLTPPPFGDTILEKAFGIMPNSITLSGNIDQVEFLKKATPDDVKARVKEVLEKAKNRGNFILNTTDYFEEGTPYKNIFALCEAGLEFGRY
jgi:hypothetical protein